MTCSLLFCYQWNFYIFTCQSFTFHKKFNSISTKIFFRLAFFEFFLFFFLNTANPAYQHIQNQQQYTPNFQHQHPPQQLHYNGSNQFEQQQQHVPQNQQNDNTNFIHSVSSSSQQQPPPVRGDEFLSASVVRRNKNQTPSVGKLSFR